MKIKVAVLDDNKSYLNRLAVVFTGKFADKLEVYSFSSLEGALVGLVENKIDVFIASDTFEVDTKKIPSGCGFAYFVYSPEVRTLRDQKTICRYQKAEMIYKEILGIFSENATDIGFKMEGDGETRVCTFTSASGGTGASTLAVGFAKRLAKIGKKVLYMNLEKFGNSNLYFSGEGQFSFGDIIFSLKSKKVNLAIKMESYVKEDPSGVYFYSSSPNALDIAEITKDDVRQLISAIKTMNSYDFIVIDTGFQFSSSVIEIFSQSNDIIFVSDGSDVANEKFMRVYNAIDIYERQKNIKILSKVSLIYNKFSNKTGRIISDSNIRILGGIVRYENASSEQIIGQITNSDDLAKIIFM